MIRSFVSLTPNLRCVALLCGAAILVGAAGTASAQVDPQASQTWDVIRTTDGNLWKGVIVEQVPGKNYKLVMPGGSVVDVPAATVASVTKEANPAFAQQPPPAAAPAPAPAAPSLVTPGTIAFYGTQNAPAPATSVSSGPSLPRPLAHEGWRVGFQVAPVFPTSDLGDRSTLDGGTGFGGRVRVGYELMFGNFGLEPGLAVQFSRFGLQDADGAYLYIGAQPTVKAQLHLGMFAPYATFGLGFDHFRASGGIADAFDANGYNTSASGLGLDLAFGCDLFVTPTIAAGLAWQIHPGFTSYHAADGTRGLTLAFMSILFGVTYHM